MLMKDSHTLQLLAKCVKNHNRAVYIIDLDGTIADGSHRLHKLPTKDLHLTESWSEFNRMAVDDLPISSTIRLVNDLADSEAYVVILTGRSDEVKEETVAWLERHGVNYDFLIMRPATDNRKDTVIKQEFIECIGGVEKVVAAFDDSPSVIAHFRSMGITTYQVCDYGDSLHHRQDLKSHGVETVCAHNWERHSAGDHYFDVCISCGKEKDI